ncbi:Cyclin B, kinase-activating protein [Trachipleistophora hominis]|uniref:Cyclin B, kinase-activating protein n=1 Tax=Trachipleistophora hominis TaxID=72359 RepID=L7JVY1_TRAHO|nr:Cyclin B, kinase-activating protein [Trachipleistophora hominis]
MRRTVLRNITNKDEGRKEDGTREEQKWKCTDDERANITCMADCGKYGQEKDRRCDFVDTTSPEINSSCKHSGALPGKTFANDGIKAADSGKKHAEPLAEKDVNAPEKKILKEESRVGQSTLTDEERSFYEIMEMDAQSDITMEYGYAEHFFARFKDQKVLINHDYMVYQQELTWRMRTILVDWLIDVHWQLGLHPETLFLTVDLIDRFLSLRTVSKNKLQLVGVTALMVAAKYEEVECPLFSTFRMLINCDTSDLMNAERYLLMTLDFNLNYLSPLCFVRRLSIVNNYEVKTRVLAKYILELMLLNEQFIIYNAHIKACAAFYTARKILEMDNFSNLFFMLACTDKKTIKGCVNDILVMLAKPIRYDSVKRKYGVDRMMRVSAFVEEFRVKHLSKYL